MSVTERVASATKPAPRPTASMSYTAVWEPSKAGEIQLYDVTYEEYRAKYDQLWGQGWRLKGLQVADTCFYYPEDRGVSEGARLALEMAKAIGTDHVPRREPVFN